METPEEKKKEDEIINVELEDLLSDDAGFSFTIVDKETGKEYTPEEFLKLQEEQNKQ